MNFHFIQGPETIQRLKALQPGETVRFYRGNTSDLEPNPFTPHYSMLLRQVFDCAEKLESAGKVSISRTRATIQMEQKRKYDGGSYWVKFTVTDFTATGLKKENGAAGKR